jgi:glycosyltransferase involved in cell wall biosynthesis
MPAPSRVVLNALFLAPGVSGGPETYLRGLAPALANAFPSLRLTIVTTASGASSLHADGFGDFSELVSLPCEDGQRVRRQLAEQALLPLRARRRGEQIVHSLASIAPLVPGTRAVVTVHDVTFMRQPTFGRVTTLGMAFLLRAAVRRADALIAVSAAARDDICALLGVPTERFTVIHHGLERHTASAPTAEAELRRRLAIDGRRVVLCLGAKRPHKNQEVLVRSASQLPSDVVILFVGHPEPYDAELRALAAELRVEDRVRFVDYVGNADLEGLWRLAAAAAQPTLGEGFGFPVLEALEHGVPVAASDLPVLREVGGELVHHFNPRDPAAAANAIVAALDDRRARDLGPRFAATFTWSRAAAATHEVYARVLSEPR